MDPPRYRQTLLDEYYGPPDFDYSIAHVTFAKPTSPIVCFRNNPLQFRKVWEEIDTVRGSPWYLWTGFHHLLDLDTDDDELDESGYPLHKCETNTCSVQDAFNQCHMPIPEWIYRVYRKWLRAEPIWDDKQRKKDAKDAFVVGLFANPYRVSDGVRTNHVH